MYSEEEAFISFVELKADDYRSCEANTSIAEKATERRCMFTEEGTYMQLTFGKIGGEYKWIDLVWEE